MVLVSDFPNISNIHINLVRSKDIMPSFGIFKLPHSITCYTRVFASDIDVNSSISNLTIEGEILNRMAVDGVCTHDGKINHNLN